MRTLITILILVFILPQAKAQINFVPNPNFEDTIDCPANISGQFGDEIYNLTHWFPARESPDYFNSCAPVNQSTGQASVPYNGFGFQYANSGEGYVGLYTAYNSPLFIEYREYIGVQLSQGLSPGTTYYFSMKVSSGWGSWQNTYTFSNKLGILMSTIHFEAQNNPLFSNNFCTSYTDSIITDTLNWTHINFEFIADSNYNYLYIGNFFDSQNTDTLSAFGSGAYYYIDDVCLSDDSTCSIISSTNSDLTEVTKSTIFPNPIASVLQINSHKNCSFYICNNLGQVVFDSSVIKGKNEFNLDFITSGIYFIKFDSNSSEVYKIIKL